MKDLMKDYELVKEYFEDDLSRKLYDYKVNNLLYRTGEELNDYLYEIYPISKIAGFSNYFTRRGEDREIIIYGANKCGLRDYRAIIHAGYKVVAFIDDEPTEASNVEKLGLPILSLSQLVIEHSEAIVVVSNEKLADVYYNQLISVGFPRENIYKQNTKLRTEFGNIYFDLPELVNNVDSDGEVFIDAGAFDGENSEDFLKWCSNNNLKAEHIYLFEPMHEGILLCQHKLKDNSVDYIECGLGEKEEKLYLGKNGNNLRGTRVQEDGDISIDIKTIDGILAGRKATFIKMDIEGSEAAALRGGKETIKKYKPKLAISMYHKNIDLLELPKLVKEINPEYKLYLRHYSNYRWDFVMYAI